MRNETLQNSKYGKTMKLPAGKFERNMKWFLFIVRFAVATVASYGMATPVKGQGPLVRETILKGIEV